MGRAFALVVAALALAACGPPSRESARDQATQHGCDWYDKCGQIGQGKMYATRDDCETSVANSWNDLWPSSDCENKINGNALSTCLNAIDGTECMNGLDFLNTVFNKCSKDQVCSGG